MKIEVKKTITHGEFAKYMVDKFGIASFERNLADGEWFGAPSDRYNASINLKPAKYDDFAHSIRIDEDGVTLKTFEEITEDTVVPKLMTTFKKTYLEGGIGYQRVRIDENYPIKLMLNKAEAHGEPIETLHIVNDDGTHTLIWTREKGLVE